MKKLIVIIFISLSCFVFMSFINQFSCNTEVAYPEGYRSWTHVKTAINGTQSQMVNKYDGFHHIYANDKAMKGYQSGNFPDGSILVFDVFETITNKTGIEEGKRKFIDVMVKDSKNYRSTGGWGYEEFNAGTKTVRNLKDADKQQCFTCHTAKKLNDFVFSKYRD